MGNNKKDVNYKKKFKFDNQTDEYTFQLKRRRFSWWWLLLLLPLLLLIRCERTITVTTVDAESNEAIQGAEVSLNYTAHYLLKDWKFLPDEPVSRSMTTDTDGKARFEKLPCSVFSYIFYCLSRVDISATDPCHNPASARPLFHYTWNQTLRLDLLREDVAIMVVDDETSEPLAGATVRIVTAEKADSAVTDASGRAMLRQVPHCADLEILNGSCYGYADTTRFNVPVNALDDIDEATLRLRPIKESFEFFVKDVETREPIPNATAIVTLTDPRSGAKGTHTYPTNVDGRGRGFYDEGFILSKVDIKASKVHYKDSTLQGDYTVAQFKTLSEDERTVWLRPLPHTVYYQNIDSLTREPIAGVENVITVTDPAGNTTTYTEISNRNGKFPVSAKEGSKIHIESRYPGYYYDKTTDVDAFTEDEKIIEMTPIVTPLDVDLVMVIDHTGSMGAFIGMVKRNANNFADDLNKECARHRLYIKNLRLKVISYGDVAEAPLNVSPMYEMPAQKADYSAFVGRISAHGGGDEPEDGLQALREAMKTKWVSGPDETRHVIVVYTDASTHPMPAAEFGALTSQWNSMDPKSRRLILFAPEKDSWTTLSRTWPQVNHESGSLSYVLNGTGYSKVLENICKTL